MTLFLPVLPILNLKMQKDNKERCQEERSLKKTNNLYRFERPELAYRNYAIRNIQKGTPVKPSKFCLFGCQGYVHTLYFFLSFSLFLMAQATTIALNMSFPFSII